MTKLQEDISRKANALRRLASINHSLSYLLALLAAFASILASLSAIVDEISPIMLSIIAAIPAAALILQNSIKFQERSIWQFNKEYRLKDLLYQLEEGKSLEEIRVQYLEINRETLEGFPGFTLTKPLSQTEDSGANK